MVRHLGLDSSACEESVFPVSFIKEVLFPVVKEFCLFLKHKVAQCARSCFFILCSSPLIHKSVFCFCCFSFVKNATGILTWIALKLYNNLESVAILKIFVLLIQGQGILFQFLTSSSYLLLQNTVIFIVEAFLFLVRLRSKYFILLDAIVKGKVCLSKHAISV